MLETLQFEIEDAGRKLRLDRFLYDRIGTVSRMFLRALIEQNQVLVNGKTEPRGYHLQTGDRVEITFDSRAETAMTPENIPLDIIFEDAEIIVVNKPAGMLVHPSKHVKTGTLSNALAFHLNDESKIENQQSKITRPILVHRLDKETSGLLVVAKTGRAARILSAHFGRRKVKKIYYALVAGVVAPDAGTIDAPIGRVEDKPNWRVLAEGKPSQSNFRVIERRADSTLLELEPVTGRTNQLRIHCAHAGHTIIGDKIYGGRESSRLCLHAARLGFFHPNGGWLEFAGELSRNEF